MNLSRLVVLLMMLATLPAASGVSGFLSGSDLMGYCEGRGAKGPVACEAYIVGVFDARLQAVDLWSERTMHADMAAQSIPAESRQVIMSELDGLGRDLKVCTPREGVSSATLVSVVADWMKRHRERWTEGAVVLVGDAMQAIWPCK